MDNGKGGREGYDWECYGNLCNERKDHISEIDEWDYQRWAHFCTLCCLFFLARYLTSARHESTQIIYTVGRGNDTKLQQK